MACLATACVPPQNGCFDSHGPCACGTFDGFTGQATCMLNCMKDKQAGPTERDACASTCGATNYFALDPGAKGLIDCLAPPGSAPLCPCFLPPGPPPGP
jgi:hypothetical protein